MKVESFEVAVQWLKDNTGQDFSTLPVVDGIPGDFGTALISNYKLWVIAYASRLGKKLLERGYYPYWWMDRAGSGSGFSFGGSAFDYVISFVGARLEYVSREESSWHAEKHADLYRDVFIISE